MKKKAIKTTKKTSTSKKRKISKVIPKKRESAFKSWQPLRELALHTPYTMGYLSLMARRKQLKVKKIGRIWHSTMENIKDFEEKMRRQKEERNERLRNSYIEKAEKVKISVMDDEKADEILGQVQEDTAEAQSSELEARNILQPTSNSLQSKAHSHEHLTSRDTIFDEVQEELADILHEIRNKEKKLRHNYMIYRGGGRTNDINKIKAQKNKTERVSEELITDLGKLLRTASVIHEGAELNRESLTRRKESLHEAFLRDHKDSNEHLLGNYHKDNFLSVPYSYFPFEDKNNQETHSKAVPTHSKIILFLSGIMVFVATVLLVLIVLG